MVGEAIILGNSLSLQMKLVVLPRKRSVPVYVALICGRQSIQDSKVMEICFLEPKDIAKVFPSDIEQDFFFYRKV